MSKSTYSFGKAYCKICACLSCIILLHIIFLQTVLATNKIDSNKFLPAQSNYYKLSLFDEELKADENKYEKDKQLKKGEWKEQLCYDALCSNSVKYHGYIWNDWDNSKALRDTMSFSLIEHDFKSELRLRVYNSREFESFVVRPSSYNIVSERVSEHEIELIIPSYDKRKISVEFDNDRYHNLFIIVNTPDENKPNPNDSLVVYFGPGEHQLPVLKLKEGQQLYIDHGAVLFTQIEVEGNNCSIAGHGILSGAKQSHYGTQWACGDILIECNKHREEGRKNLSIRDITVIDSPSWTLSVYNMENVDIHNINMINWILNGDGIDVVCSKNVHISDCFLRCYDDCITLKVRHNAKPMSDLENVHIKNCLIWADFARGIVVGPESGNLSVSQGRIHDCSIKDCIFLEHATIEQRDDVRGAFAIHHFKSPEWNEGEIPTLSDIKVKNLVFDNLDASSRAIVIATDNSVQNSIMERIDISDVKIYSNGASLEIFYPYDNKNFLKLRRIWLNDKRLNAKKLKDNINKK